MMPMIIIKLGGSLLASGRLGPCLDKIERDYRKQGCVIVPGGGVFADQVRQLQDAWQFDDRTAHLMAILAMQQIALLIKGLKPAFRLVERLGDFHPAQPAITVWSPDIAGLDADHLPATWELSSDSLSAWLAHKLSARLLIIVKSALIPKNQDMQHLIDNRIVDPLFDTFARQGKVMTTIIHVDDFINGQVYDGNP